jgi:signal transduction histidine kinase
MTLAAFITRDMERILVDWEAFAATRLPDAGALELRDHARQILEAIATDLRTPQSDAAQAAKSQGLTTAPVLAGDTAAQVHAVLRAKSGFDIKQLASEYRALRASVLSLWMTTVQPAEISIQQVIRFNEAIDQALAESIAHFASQVETSRNLLLGMLSHDMRSPLQTIQMTARYLGKLNAGDAVATASRRLMDSGTRMQGLLDDLVDFNRANLGLGIGIEPADVDLRPLLSAELEQIRAARPGRQINATFSGDCRGRWDGRRIQQVLCNLVVNAITHGAPDTPVAVEVSGDDAELRLRVRNSGAAIPEAKIEELFQPLKRGTVAPDEPGMGLGLYIVSEIAKAHGGSAGARSDSAATVFEVRLPRARVAEAVRQKVASAH